MIDFGTIIGGVGAIGSALGGLLTSKKDTSDEASADLSRATGVQWGAMNNTQDAVERAMEAYQNAFLTSRADLNNALEQSTAQLRPYAAGGLKGFNSLVNALAPQGMTAVDQISGLPPGVGANIVEYLTKTPVYQFPFQQGLNALDRSAASRGMLLSGAQAKGAQEYGQNFALSNALGPAMQNYQNYLRNIAGLGNMGMQAGTQMGNWFQGTGNQLANVAMDTGKLYGSANLAGAGMQNQLAQGLAGSYTNQALMDQAAANRYSNAMGSLIGSGAGVLGNVLGSVLGGIGTGSVSGGSPWTVSGSNVLGGPYQKF